MPSADHRLPKYRHYRPKNLAVVRIDGRDHYLGKYDSPESRERYHRLLAEWNASGTVARVSKSNDLSVNELCLLFFQHAENYYRRADGQTTGEVENLRLAIRPLEKLYGLTSAKDFGPIALKRVRQSMIDAGLARRTINQRIARIIRVFRHGVENELIPASVHHALKAVAGLKRGRSGAKESKAVKPVPEAHVEAVKPFVSRQVWAMIELQRLTGMRSGEVVIMRTIDVDTSGKLWIYRPTHHKTEHHDKDRKIPIGPRAIEILSPWLRLNVEEFVFQPREAQVERWCEQRRNRKSPLTPSQQARTRKSKPKKTPSDHYDPRSYFHAVDRACKRANISHWHPHQLRHNFATLVRKDYGLDAARIILGHSSSSVTETYAERDESKALDVISRIG
jgi:integrase